jgi:replicative DNA helicase
VSGKPDLERFFNQIGALSQEKKKQEQGVLEYLGQREGKTNRDVLPHELWRPVAASALQTAGLTQQQVRIAMGGHQFGTTANPRNLTRERAVELARIIGSEQLLNLAQSDVYWDPIVSIEPDGEAEVYDLTVDKLHNFIANCNLIHNSIEQDADVVCFIYRDEVYNESDENRGIAELLIRKQRNGPTGDVKMAFLKEFTRFENMWKE